MLTTTNLSEGLSPWLPVCAQVSLFAEAALRRTGSLNPTAQESDNFGHEPVLSKGCDALGSRSENVLLAAIIDLLPGHVATSHGSLKGSAAV